MILTAVSTNLFELGIANMAKSTKPFWETKSPKKESKKLTPAQKASAKASAKKAGRPYPNLIDNAAAARRAK